jgi:hypothetical protein
MKKYRLISLLLISSTLFMGCGNSEKEAPSDYLNYTTKTYLQFPFREETIIAAGGRSVKENGHAVRKVERFAIDIVAAKDGVTPQEAAKDDINTYSYSGDKSKNESYYVFGKEVVATGEGTIVLTENTVADNVPGVENGQDAEGNHVVIDHGNGEFSLFSHLKQGSVRVQVGDKVKYGDVLGLCGNSGNSSQAHLHYQLQTNKNILDGEGLPAQFNRYIANGEFIQRGEPVSGQIIVPE